MSVIQVTTEKDRRLKEELADNSAQINRFFKQQGPLSKVEHILIDFR